MKQDSHVSSTHRARSTAGWGGATHKQLGIHTLEAIREEKKVGSLLIHSFIHSTLTPKVFFVGHHSE